MQSTQGMNVMNRIGTVYQLCCILIQQRQMQAVTQSFTNDEMDKVNRHSITCRESVCAFFFSRPSQSFAIVMCFVNSYSHSILVDFFFFFHSSNLYLLITILHLHHCITHFQYYEHRIIELLIDHNNLLSSLSLFSV